jgi:hypothetical protein
MTIAVHINDEEKIKTSHIETQNQYFEIILEVFIFFQYRFGVYDNVN